MYKSKDAEFLWSMILEGRTHKQQKSDDFDLNPDDFLFAKAEGNYLEIYFEKGDKAKKVLKRFPKIKCPNKIFIQVINPKSSQVLYHNEYPLTAFGFK
jgi:hypothetical protein